MKLKTINNFLRLFGFVLVLEIDDENKKPTLLYIIRNKKYLKRVE